MRDEDIAYASEDLFVGLLVVSSNSTALMRMARKRPTCTHTHAPFVGLARMHNRMCMLHSGFAYAFQSARAIPSW